MNLLKAAGLAILCCMSLGASAAPPAGCAAEASDGCYFSFVPAGANGQFHYYASRSPADDARQPSPTRAIVVLHGHPRDANISFNAVWKAVSAAGVTAQIAVVAPVFQVAAAEASKCQTAGVPAARAGDLLWTCSSWIGGEPSVNGHRITAFAALDGLVIEMRRRWPGLQVVTVAGFSAGAQMLQRQIGFSTLDPSARPALRYVVSDPGTWLYFDAERPYPTLAGQSTDWSKCNAGLHGLGQCILDWSSPRSSNACPSLNQWKYGTDALPAALNRSAAEARARYAAADIRYLEAELDQGNAPGAFAKILDKSCAADAQGPYRLQRGLAYAVYDRRMLAPSKNRRVTIVPGCAHDVACVFPSAAARPALLGDALPLPQTAPSR